MNSVQYCFPLLLYGEHLSERGLKKKQLVWLWACSFLGSIYDPSHSHPYISGSALQCFHVTRQISMIKGLSLILIKINIVDYLRLIFRSRSLPWHDSIVPTNISRVTKLVLLMSLLNIYKITECSSKIGTSYNSPFILLFCKLL